MDRASTANSAGLRSYLKEEFRQRDVLQARGYPVGACLALSGIWLQNTHRSAASRIQHLRGDGADAAVNFSQLYETSHGMQALFTEMGIDTPEPNQMPVVDIMTNEETAMDEIATAISRNGTKHLLLLNGLAGGHAIACSRGDGGRVNMFDPNLGEFAARPSEVINVLRGIIRNTSSDEPIPSIRICTILN
jgi:hypothetical protein